MFTTRELPTTSDASSSDLPQPRRPRWQRALRTTGIIVASILVATLVSTVANAAISAADDSGLDRYGQTIHLDAGDITVTRSGGPGPVLVLLSGYGTPAPAIDFAPLVRELEGFDVIVIEGFGYGLSDLDVTDRSVQNITGEIHSVLSELGIDEPVIMAGHSMGGLYTRYYAAEYPDEVSAVIGLDPMTATTSTLEVGDTSPVMGWLATIGLYRWVTALAPDLVQPPGTAFTDSERSLFAPLANRTFSNPSVSDEWARLAANSTTTNARPFPTGIPVLQLLSTESVEGIPTWLDAHQDELANVETHQLEVIEGAHYLHWTQAPLMAQLITEFIAAHVGD